jgi:glc operon protein GlcG
MADTVAALKLTCEGAMKLLNAAMAKASAMGVPQCISVVDAGGHLLAFARIAAGLDLKLAIATRGKRINLPGGLPIIVDGHVIGGIGVGSGTGEQDREVANAALAAFPGARRFD